MTRFGKSHLLRSKPSLADVFGIAEHVKDHSYIDRGGLDSQMHYALGAERHIAVHGASKQGKSWLRSRLLDEDSFILVQCQTGSSLESLLTDALGALGVRAELRRTSSNEFEGTLDFRTSGSVGLHLLGRLGMDTSSGLRRSRSWETESEPVGRTPANLWWVARTILTSGKRLVIEDCHYLGNSCFQDLAFILKALGGYGLGVLIAGIWAQDHLLTYYNGDLVGRVEDIHLTWSDDELNAVLQKGSTTLNIAMSTSLRRHLIADAAGNVGLLQQLAEAICREEQVLTWQGDTRFITVGPSLDRAREAVANSMKQRFQGFADNFANAMQRACPSANNPQAIFRGVIACTDEQLLQGIETDVLSRAIQAAQPHTPIPYALGEVMEKLSDAQASMAIRPPVLTYNRHSNRVHVADRSLLFYRRYGSPHWY